MKFFSRLKPLLSVCLIARRPALFIDPSSLNHSSLSIPCRTVLDLARYPLVRDDRLLPRLRSYQKASAGNRGPYFYAVNGRLAFCPAININLCLGLSFHEVSLFLLN